MTEMMWSLLPWLTFMTATPLVNLWAGLAAGLVVAIMVLGRAIAHKKVRMLEVASIAFFVGLAAAVVVVHPADIGSWGNYAQAGAHGLLTALVLGSVLIGRPFTAPYARAQAPEAVWPNPRRRLQPGHLPRVGLRPTRRHRFAGPGRVGQRRPVHPAHGGSVGRHAVRHLVHPAAGHPGPHPAAKHRVTPHCRQALCTTGQAFRPGRGACGRAKPTARQAVLRLFTRALSSACARSSRPFDAR